MPYDKCDYHHGAQNISHERQHVTEAIGQSGDKSAQRHHHPIVKKIFLVVNNSWLAQLPCSIHLVVEGRVSAYFHGNSPLSFILREWKSSLDVLPVET